MVGESWKNDETGERTEMMKYEPHRWDELQVIF